MRRLLNPLFFAARQRLAFRRAGYAERPGSGPALDRAQRVRLAGPRAAELAARYGLEALRPRLADATWLVVLSFADLLDRVVAFEPALADLPEPAAVLDVGAKNFEAAPALLHVLARAGRGDGSAPRLVRLTGIELDAHRVYRTLHSRADAAAYYLGLLPSPPGAPHAFVAGDVRDHAARHDLVTWFSPFLDRRRLLRWGLPARAFAPGPLLRHVAARVRPGGFLLVVNPSSGESAVQRALFEDQGLGPVAGFATELEVYLRTPWRGIHLVRG